MHIIVFTQKSTLSISYRNFAWIWNSFRCIQDSGDCTVWKVVNDTLKKLTANLTTQLYSKFQSNLRKDLPLQNGFIGPLDYKFMYLVHATPPYNCDLELGQNHYIKWHFCSFQINFLLCLVYKLVKKTSDWWHTDHNKSPQKGIGKKYEIELLCRDAT